MLRKWDDLPSYMRTNEVRPYYDKLKRKKVSLFIKRMFDIFASVFMLIALSPVMIILSIAILIDSKGRIFFRQERITQYGRKFHIHKFRTMVEGADKIGSQVTIGNDIRVTKVGHMLRKYRLDELPQLIDILVGNMSFVGTRPEIVKYVKCYKPEMFATLLMPAGVTSKASILVMDDEKLLENVKNVDNAYVNELLPRKMIWNLDSLDKFSLFGDLVIMIKTVWAVVNKKN